MALTKKIVLRKIEITNDLEGLLELENEIDFSNFDDGEIEEISEALTTKKGLIIDSNPKRKSIEPQIEGLPFDPNLYDRDDSQDKPSFTEIIKNLSMSHIDFLREVFFKDFLELPSPEIQVPVIISLLFQNSMTIPDKCRLPMVYIYSAKEDSGKSTLLYHFMNYYHPKLRLYFGEDITGAGLRNNLSPLANLDRPIIVGLDNFNAVRTKERLGVIGWGALLKYTRNEAKRNIIADAEGGTVEFNSHAFKVFTSITELGKSTEKSSELRSRCIPIHCEPSKNLRYSVDSFNWDDCQKEYFNVWGNPDYTNRVYKKGILKELQSMNPLDLPIQNRKWLLSIAVISVGVFIGVWKSIDEGINHMVDYWAWESGKKIVKLTPLEAVIHEYVNEVHPKAVERELELIRGTARIPLLSKDFIRLSEIYDYLGEYKGVKQQQTFNTDNNITQIMYDLGFASEVERHIRTNKPIGLKFFKL